MEAREALTSCRVALSQLSCSVMAKKRRSQLSAAELGRVGDDHFAMFDQAKKDLARNDNPRRAAEWAYLGLHTALENSSGVTFTTDRAQTYAVGLLAKHNRKLAKEFNDLKQYLHGECFYQGRKTCDAIDVAQAVGRARFWAEFIPKKLK